MCVYVRQRNADDARWSQAQTARYPSELIKIDAHKVEIAAADGPLRVVIEVYAQITASMKELGGNDADRHQLHSWRVRALGIELPKWLHIADSEGWFPA